MARPQSRRAEEAFRSKNVPSLRVSVVWPSPASFVSSSRWCGSGPLPSAVGVAEDEAAVWRELELWMRVEISSRLAAAGTY